MNHKKQGYLKSYQASLDRLQQTKAAECQQLSAEWSETRHFAPHRPCPRCGKPLPVNNFSVPRNIITKIGAVAYRRHYYYCAGCQFGFYPRDEELGLDPEDLTDDVIALALDFALNDPFALSAQRLELHHQIKLSATKMQHLFQRQTAPLDAGEKPRPVVELPVSPRNAHQPVVIQNDGSMIRRTDDWHEVKLLRVGLLNQTEAVYFAEARDKDRFEDWLREARGFSQLRGRTVLWLGDGAPYNWGLQQRLCPHAQALVDFYHVLEKLSACAAVLFTEKDYCAGPFVATAAKLLLRSEAKLVISQLKECQLLLGAARGDKHRREELRKLMGYLVRNRDRLDYQFFREHGWPIGSGAIESAHKWVLQKRMKQAGMKWSPQHAQQMAVARAVYASVGPFNFYRYLTLAKQNAA